MTMQTQSVKLSSFPVSHNLREFEELHDTEQAVRTFLQGAQAGMTMAKHIDDPGYMVKNVFKDKAVDLVAPAEKDETDEFSGVTFVARHHQALDADGKPVTPKIFGIFVDYATDCDSGTPEYLWGLYKSATALRQALIDNFDLFYGDVISWPENEEILTAIENASTYDELVALAEKADNHKIEIREIDIAK